MTIGAADQGKPTRRIPKRDTAVCYGGEKIKPEYEVLFG